MADTSERKGNSNNIMASLATNPDQKQTILKFLQFLRDNNLQETETVLKKEIKLDDSKLPLPEKTEKPQTPSAVSQALAAYKSSDDPRIYQNVYSDLKAFIDTCLDVHKVELSMILYPVFIHMYLELVYNGHGEHAFQFFQRFSRDQEDYRADDLARLVAVQRREHMEVDQIMSTFKSSKFVIRMSRDSYTHLKRHLQEKHLTILINMIQEHLFIEVFDGMPRTQEQIHATSGALLGEAEKEANKVRVYYGLLKEPDLNIPLEDEEEGEGDGDGTGKPKKKKAKKDPLLLKKSKNDPNAPQPTRIPLPELKDQDKVEKIAAFREALKRVKLSSEQLPSICFYTFLNSTQGVTCVDFTDDSTMLAAGFQDSNVRVWSLTPNKLRAMKSAADLEIIDKEADDVLERMMDDMTGTDTKLLVGHAGPVYAVSFSPDKNGLISSSQDGTVRLWNLKTWTNIVCYKGHNYPVWDAKFGPHGHYFLSGGMDRTGRLWSTDHYQPLRLFVGHQSDVECVQFHPNSNYVATGSSDRTVRLWDVLNGTCVRIMTGHKASIQCMTFSSDGKYLATAGVDHTVIVWDIASGTAVAHLTAHTNVVYALCFSRDGTVLASGGMDNSIRLWDLARIMEEQDPESDNNIPSSLSVNTNPALLLGTYYTKCTPVLGLHFTRRNVLIGCGPYVTS
ncbi:transcription initiation factor TFIID subunit 5-like [Babylonia areolata]|uniref:transcription initiation factor TFIID subunit 5-like n=1 Tax=Babylonia areolata TaxID=304850 RepID=UPI003FCFFAE9